MFVSVNLYQLPGNILKLSIFTQHSLMPPSDPLPHHLGFNSRFSALYKLIYLLTYLQLLTMTGHVAVCLPCTSENISHDISYKLTPVTVDMAHLLHPSNLRHINDINNNNNNDP